MLQLKVNGNALTGAIPPELCKLKSLMVLELWSNHLTGAIPTRLAHLPRLKQIMIDSGKDEDGHADGNSFVNADAFRAVLEETNPSVVKKGTTFDFETDNRSGSKHRAKHDGWRTKHVSELEKQ